VYDSANEIHVSKASKIRAHGETVANIPTGRGNICTIGCGHEYLMYGERFRFTVMKMEAKRTKLTAHDGTTIRARRFELTIKRSEMENAVTLKNIWKVRRPRRRRFLPIKFLNNIEFEGYTGSTWTAYGGKCSEQCPKRSRCHFKTVDIETHSNTCKLIIKFKEVMPELVTSNIGHTPAERRAWERGVERSLRQAGIPF